MRNRSQPGAFLCILILAFATQKDIPILSAQATDAYRVADQTEANAYKTLFRQSASYIRLADEADAARTPKSHLRRILTNRFGLSAANNASLDRLSLTYKTEADAIHAKVLAAKATFRLRFPNGVITSGADAKPPSEFQTLQQQDIALSLHYRDLLRNTMSETDFQMFHQQVLSSLRSQIQSSANINNDGGKMVALD